MPIQHNSLTGSDLHEPKGVASASSGTVYKANGGGSGNWSYVSETIASAPLYMNNADSSVLIPLAQAGRVRRAVLVLSDAPTAAGAEIVATLRSASGVTLGTATFPVGTSVKGSVVEIPLSTTVTQGSFFEVVCTTASTNSVTIFTALSIEVL